MSEIAHDMKVENSRLISVGRNQQKLPWLMKAHSHPFHEMIVIIQGGQYVRIHGKEIHAEEGDILFYPKRIPHEEWTVKGKPLESLFFSFEWGDYHADVPIHVRDRRGRVRAMAEWLSAETAAHTVITPMVSRSLFQALLGQFISLWKCKEEDFVGTIRRHAREHIKEEIALDHLAEVSGMSKFHFVRRYRKLTGRTPMADVRMIRLEYARELVLTTSLPLKIIAEKAGIGDQYQMSKLFRRYAGSSPGSLRRHTSKKGRQDK